MNVLTQIKQDEYSTLLNEIQFLSAPHKNSKSKKNKTIDFDVNSLFAQKMLKNCVVPTNKKFTLNEIINKTIVGDFFSTVNLLPKKCVDLLIVDPPYNLTKNYHGSKFDRMNTSAYKEYTKKWLMEIIPVLKDYATIYICCDPESSLIIGNIINKLFIIQNRITWQREKGRGAKSNWKNAMEDIWFATISKKDFTFNLNDVKIRRKVIAPYKENGKPKDWFMLENGEKYRDTCPSNFWDDITIPYWSMQENTAHPTQKPEKLIAKLILASSNKGDIVFDPFLGSGTTSVVAKKLNRNYIGIEQNKTYCAWAEKRLKDAETHKKIQGFNDGVFWERNTNK